MAPLPLSFFFSQGRAGGGGRGGIRAKCIKNHLEYNVYLIDICVFCCNFSCVYSYAHIGIYTCITVSIWPVCSRSHINTEILFRLPPQFLPFALQWKVNMNFSMYPFELCSDSLKLFFSVCAQI